MIMMMMTMMGRQLFGLFVALLLFCALSASAATTATTTTTTTTCPTDSQHPVVFVPGLMASIMEGHLTNVPLSDLPQPLCARNTDDWEVLWVKIGTFLPWTFDCIMHYISMAWKDNTTPINQAGVTTRIPDGRNGLYAIDQLDTTDTLVSSLSNMYHVAIEALKSAGFVEGKTIFGLGTDWRQVPSDDWIGRLRTLIETAYTLNNNRRVVLVGHSLGCPYSFTFLNTQTLEWRRKYIEMYMPVAPVYSGTGMAAFAMLGKAFLGMPYPFSVLGEVARTFPSIFLLLPNAGYDYTKAKGEPVVVKTDKYVYTPKNISELLLRAGIPWGNHGMNIANAAIAKGGLVEMNHPGVPVTVLWSKGVPTIKYVEYLSDSFVGALAPIPVMSDGDGLVEISSLEYAYNHWTAQGKPVNKVVMPDAINHLAIISDPRFVAVLLNASCRSGTWADSEVPVTAQDYSYNASANWVDPEAAGTGVTGRTSAAATSPSLVIQLLLLLTLASSVLLI